MPSPIAKNIANNARPADKNGRWLGGRIQDGTGYMQILLRSDDPFYQMTNARNYVLEHRLIMAKHLGRLLEPWEIVHHINGIKDDNRIENLELMSVNEHNRISVLEKQVLKLRREVARLQEEVAKLQTESRKSGE